MKQQHKEHREAIQGGFIFNQDDALFHLIFAKKGKWYQRRSDPSLALLSPLDEKESQENRNRAATVQSHYTLVSFKGQHICLQVVPVTSSLKLSALFISLGKKKQTKNKLILSKSTADGT